MPTTLTGCDQQVSDDDARYVLATSIDIPELGGGLNDPNRRFSDASWWRYTVCGAANLQRAIEKARRAGAQVSWQQCFPMPAGQAADPGQTNETNKHDDDTDGM